MNKIFSIAFIVHLCICLCNCGKNTPKEAVLKSENDSLNLGIVHDSADFAFKIKSVGNDTLKVLKLASGCGCTQVATEKTNIPPGDSTLLKGRYTPETLGEFEKSIVINTNTEKKFHVLRIRGTSKSIRKQKEKHP
ncbi:MAG: DUF1573 domain-containing protein [Sphingomonadales bacterium]|jgi:hypothetical protein